MEQDEPHLSLHYVRNISTIIAWNVPCITQPFTRLLHYQDFWSASKLVKNSSPCKSMKIRENSTIAWILLQKRRNVDFHRVSKTHCVSNRQSIWMQKVPKRSVIEWASSFHKFFFSKMLDSFYMNARISKIRSLHTYEVLWMFYFG